MPRIANLYFRTAIVFLILGISIGLHMSITGNHAATGAHAHANLLGWVTMAIFGGITRSILERRQDGWP